LIKKTSHKELRDQRHRRMRNKVRGTAERPRLCIYKSLQHTYAQIIDDDRGITLVSASTLDKDLTHLPNKSNAEAAREVGMKIAERAKEQGINTVVFDRNGLKYHGTVLALAEGARENGLVF